jgi:ribonuclease HI
MIEIFFDGLCQPKNPGGIACYAFVIRKDAVKLHSEYGVAAKPFSKDSTNNVAEYTALIKALEWLKVQPERNQPVKVMSDSQLVVNQLNGKFKIKAPRIIPLYKRALALKRSFDSLEISWVPREENSEADSLTNKAYREALGQLKKAKSDKEKGGNRDAFFPRA